MPKDTVILYVVGRILKWYGDRAAWEVMGIFDDERKAKDVCDEHSFVGPIELNKVLPKKAMTWPEAYYPRRLNDDKR